VINLIGAFQFFDLSYVMTQAGPATATAPLSTTSTRPASNSPLRYASTLAMMLFAILVVFTMIQVRMSRRWVFYQVGRP